jgi:hypothetical protein
MHQVCRTHHRKANPLASFILLIGSDLATIPHDDQHSSTIRHPFCTNIISGGPRRTNNNQPLPVIDQTIPPHERAHAFHINKTALSGQNIDLRLQLGALGNQLNLSTAEDGTINDWFQIFFDSWFDFTKLTILSFHNLKGDIILDTTDAADPAVLLPVVNGPLNTCRKANVKYIRVQITINFPTLVNVNPSGLTRMCAEYYIKLPQTSQRMLNKQNTAYNLLTFQGASDLCTL